MKSTNSPSQGIASFVFFVTEHFLFARSCRRHHRSSASPYNSPSESVARILSLLFLTVARRARYDTLAVRPLPWGDPRPGLSPEKAVSFFRIVEESPNGSDQPLQRFAAFVYRDAQ
jgi:hypothetical protein